MRALVLHPKDVDALERRAPHTIDEATRLHSVSARAACMFTVRTNSIISPYTVR